MQIHLFQKKPYLIGMAILLIALLGASLAFSLPLLSDRYSKVNRTVVIDAGHGSIDPGCTYDTLKEKDINLQVAFLLKELLEESNIHVVMTRTEDVLHNRSRHDDIIYRANMPDKVNADAFISIHVNKFPTTEPFGGQAYYYSGEHSKQLAELIQEQLKAIQPNNYRSVGRGDYFVLKKTASAAIIVEIGFISNPTDRQRITNSAEQQKIASAIRDGLINYFYTDFANEDNLTEETITPAKPTDSSGYNLYFASRNSTNTELIPVHTPFTTQNSLSVHTNQHLTVLEITTAKTIHQLLQCPNSDLISVIPPGTELKSLKIENGLATLNFNSALIENHWGGAEAEKATVEAIVKTLTSLPGIDQVQILVEGQSSQTIAGHIIFDEPLTDQMF